MHRARFRFYAELNDFLPRERKQVEFSQLFEGTPSIKDMIEALGVPHTEVDLILVNGESVDFSYLVMDGDRASVYPVFESIDIMSVGRVRPRPLRESRFVLDGHLGKLARYLRLLGFDTLYQNDCQDAELARISSGEGRILLTQDRGLLKRRIVTHGYCVRETRPRLQLIEVLRRFDLAGSMTPFERCLRCNGLLEPACKEAVAARLPAGTRERHDEIFACRGCGQLFWKGSHHARMEQFIERLRAELSGGQVAAG